MTRTIATRFQRWFAYERDAHEKLRRSFETVPEERRADAAYQDALDLLGHLIAARAMWLFRMGAAEEGPAELFPKGESLDALSARQAAVEASWSAYLESLDDAALASSFTYRSYEGERYRNQMEDILTQLFGHSWYHRGQIARAIRSLGGEPAVTDLIFWTREPVDGTEGRRG